MNRKLSRIELRKIIVENINILKESRDVTLNDHENVKKNVIGFYTRLNNWLKLFERNILRRPPGSWKHDVRTRMIASPHTDIEKEIVNKTYDASIIRRSLIEIVGAISRYFAGPGKHQELIALASFIIKRIREIESKSM